MIAGASTARSSKRPGKRAYRMNSRATAAAATKDRIREAATELFTEVSYDAVSLEAVARRARVSLLTVLRKFKAKEALFMECAQAFTDREWEARAVVRSGDIRGAVRVLAERYEQVVPLSKRYLDVESRFPVVTQALDEARQGHLAWLAEVFKPFLSKRPGKLRTQQLAALFGATESYLWWTWRKHLALNAREAEEVMFHLVETLIRRWSRERDNEHRK